MLNVVHVTSWLSRNGGGIPPVIRALAKETGRLGIHSPIVGLMDKWVKDDCRDEAFHIFAEKIIGPDALGYSPGLRKQLRLQAKPAGIIHSHGLWTYPGLAARKCAQENGCRLLISPHGMLEPWALRNSRWKKKLAERIFERRNLEKADCLHALCQAEAENFRRYGLKKPIAVIPNGVGLDELEMHPQDAIIEKVPELKGCRRILFLSRLHPKKGLVNLLNAWKRMMPDFREWRLFIVGGGEPGYVNELKDIAKKLLPMGVVFPGPLFENDKRQILAAADVFILPSFSEGFSMAILEAAAAGLPVLLTRECNFPELAKSSAAVEISPDVLGIEAGLRQVLGLTEDQRKAMGNHGRTLIRKSYTWPAIAKQMCLLYDWILGNGPKPEFVDLG